MTGLLRCGSRPNAAPRAAPRDGDVVLRRRYDADASSAVSFLVEHQGRVAGTVEVKHMEGGNGEVSNPDWMETVRVQ